MLCRNCSQEVAWHRTAAGKFLALVRVPHKEGTVTVGDDGVARIDGRGGGRYRIHESKCATNREPVADVAVNLAAKGGRWVWSLRQGERVRTGGVSEQLTAAYAASAAALREVLRGQLALSDW